MPIIDELARLTDLWKGRKVYVKDESGHPHAGEMGEVECFEMVGGKPAVKVNGDYNSFYVFDAKDLKQIT